MNKDIKMRIVLLFLFMLFYTSANAELLKVAAGAGYKKPMMEVIKEYEEGVKKIEPFFGNMKQVSAQAKQTNMSLIVGDKRFLSKKSKLEFKGFVSLGKGRVVVAYPKGKKLDDIYALMRDDIKRVSMPQPKKAIYGIAGVEFLNSTEMYEKIKDKLYIVATVPQSMTYIVANEVDAGVVNLTAALANISRIGGYVEVPERFYKPIDIVAGKLLSCNTKECEEFIEFLQTDTAKDIFKKYGL